MGKWRISWHSFFFNKSSNVTFLLVQKYHHKCHISIMGMFRFILFLFCFVFQPRWKILLTKYIICKVGIHINWICKKKMYRHIWTHSCCEAVTLSSYYFWMGPAFVNTWTLFVWFITLKITELGPKKNFILLSFWIHAVISSDVVLASIHVHVCKVPKHMANMWNKT